MSACGAGASGGRRVRFVVYDGCLGRAIAGSDTGGGEEGAYKTLCRLTTANGASVASASTGLANFLVLNWTEERVTAMDGDHSFLAPGPILSRLILVCVHLRFLALS